MNIVNLCCALAGMAQTAAVRAEDDLAGIFAQPPAAARPGVMWMWMGRNITRQSISRDLEAFHEAGYGRTLANENTQRK